MNVFVLQIHVSSTQKSQRTHLYNRAHIGHISQLHGEHPHPYLHHGNSLHSSFCFHSPSVPQPWVMFFVAAERSLQDQWPAQVLSHCSGSLAPSTGFHSICSSGPSPGCPCLRHSCSGGLDGSFLHVFQVSNQMSPLHRAPSITLSKGMIPNHILPP